MLTSLTDVTADLVIDALNERGTFVVRVDPADLLGGNVRFTASLGTGETGWSGTVSTHTRRFELGGVTAVYYRRPSRWSSTHPDVQTAEFSATEGRHGFGGLLYNLPNASYVNHPSAISRAEFKPGQLQAAARIDFALPPTLITNDPEEARAFAIQHAPVIYKPLRGLRPDPDGRAGAIWAQRIDPASIDDAVSATAHLFQAEVSEKTADVRVTVVANQVFASAITTTEQVLDWRRADWDHLRHRPISVPERIVEKLHAYLAHYGLVFGCFDFAVTGTGSEPGDWVWLECNPNGQWGFLDNYAEIAAAFGRVLSLSADRSC
ncbi:hypothetical protein [Spiractinospora alimapuensis]|uniref:hypothetical protein n=1 Tax=Spiractinospora alimapuensis TaxID=2820884 RepID=UPI001F22299E|nr:hypothetical protein [Spiractinospora alimapuensis]